MTEQIVELGAKNNALKWNKEDILRWKTDIDTRLENSTKRKYWRILRDFLDYYNIKIIEDMLHDKDIRMPQVPPKEIFTLDEETIWKIHDASFEIKGWPGEILRFVTLAYPFTGLRPSELRTLRYEDLDLDNWIFQVSTPKGEDSYGCKRSVGVPPILRESWTEFMKTRKKYLKRYGLPEDYEFLFPYRARYKLKGCWESKWNEMKRELNGISGIEFLWKDYRSSFCQMAIDKGANLQAVSKVMGHQTTRTTESYYGRIRDMDAIKEIDSVFNV